MFDCIENKSIILTHPSRLCRKYSFTNCEADGFEISLCEDFLYDLRVKIVVEFEFIFFNTVALF